MVPRERSDEFRGRDGVDAVALSTVKIRRGFCSPLVLEIFERSLGCARWGGEL